MKPHLRYGRDGIYIHNAEKENAHILYETGRLLCAPVGSADPYKRMLMAQPTRSDSLGVSRPLPCYRGSLTGTYDLLKLSIAANFLFWSVAALN